MHLRRVIQSVPLKATARSNQLAAMGLRTLGRPVMLVTARMETWRRRRKKRRRLRILRPLLICSCIALEALYKQSQEVSVAEVLCRRLRSIR